MLLRPSLRNGMRVVDNFIYMLSIPLLIDLMKPFLYDVKDILELHQVRKNCRFYNITRIFELSNGDCMHICVKGYLGLHNDNRYIGNKFIFINKNNDQFFINLI
jgi:hypothetical protein